jgi:hypothetical protein
MIEIIKKRISNRKRGDLASRFINLSIFILILVFVGFAQSESIKEKNSNKNDYVNYINYQGMN